MSLAALFISFLGSFLLGAAVVYNYFRKKHHIIHDKYYRELVENYNLELQNKWLRESMH